jgi:hypothetical protein
VNTKGTDVARQERDIFLVVVAGKGLNVRDPHIGSTLEPELIDSPAQLLQAKQEMLTTDLQLSDLKLKLNDLTGMPLTTALDLDPAVPEFQETCPREQCVSAAVASHPKILAARAEVRKAEAVVRFAKTDLQSERVEQVKFVKR